MTIQYLLDSRNYDGEIYNCDIKRLFGWDLTDESVKELKGYLTEMAKVNDSNRRKE